MSAFDFDFPHPSTSLHDTPQQEEVVPKPVLPEISGLMTFDFGSVDLNHDLVFPLPSNSEPDGGHIRSSSTKPSKKKKVVPKSRPRRAALGLQYSSYEERLQTLTEDPFVRAIIEDENKVLCAGCEKDIQLDNRRRRSLHLQNWKTHRIRCAGIKGINKKTRST
jgi:hypothetical protein